MLHLGSVLLFGIACQLNPLLGNVRVLEGKLIDADAKDKIVTMMTHEGTIQHLTFDETSRAFTSTRTLTTFQNPTLQRGTRVRVVFDTSKQVIRELICVPTATKPK
jgi:hypothetical protein